MPTAGMKQLYNAIKVKREKEAEFQKHDASVKKMLDSLFGESTVMGNMYREENFMKMMEKMGSK